MKRAAKAIAGVALWAVWLGGCGGGTLGGNGGMIGTISGAAGVTRPGSGGGGVSGDGVGAGGFGGDIAPPPGGRGGPGGTFGMGGRSGMCPSVVPPVCGNLCGNGRIDSCTAPATSGCPAWTEECDGADLGGSDGCSNWGYNAGKVSCNGDCTVNLTGCSFCVPDRSVLSCGPSEIPLGQQTVGDMALAANDTEVAVATVTYRSIDGSAAVSLARLSSALALQHNLVLDDNSQPGPLYQAGLFGTAVAPIPSGWVVAVCGRPEIYIHAVDATTGVDVGRTVVSPTLDPSNLCFDGKPVLAARPDGGPLMLWQTDDGVTMSMIGADGLSASPPLTIVGAPQAIASQGIGAAWVGSEFAVAVPIEVTGGNGGRAIRLLRVLPDGTPRFVGDFWPGEVDRLVRVAMSASDVRVVYNALLSPYPQVMWWRRAADGLSTPQVPLTGPFLADDASAVAVGDDTLVLLMQNGYGSSLSVTRVAADGQPVTPLYDIVNAAPYDVLVAPQMVRRGPEAVVGWHSLDQISLARIRP